MSSLPTFNTATRVVSVAGGVLKNTSGNIEAFFARTDRQRKFLVDRRIKLIEAASSGNLDINPLALKKLYSDVLRVGRLVQVLPNEDFADIHRQLQKNERVHSVSSIEELLKNRIGSIGMNKDVQALIVPTYNGPKVLAQIFRIHVTAKTDEHGRIFVNTLPHDVDAIKSSPVQPLTEEENVTGYWTISSDWRGAGPVLVSDLGQVSQGRFETTISPIRNYTKGLERDKYLPAMKQCGEDFVRYNVLSYLEKGLSDPDSRNMDPVMRFHLSNGAFVGWVNVNPKSDKDWIVMNYIYDRSMLAQNRAIFNSGKLPVSEALANYSSNVMPVKSTRLAPLALAA